MTERSTSELAPASSRVPLVDLRLQHARVAPDVEAAVKRVMDDASFVLGPQVEAFEREFAEYSGAAHCVGVGNGTDALELALRAGGVGEEDEVIVPANTFVATAEAVVRCGARVVLVDCDDDFLIDVREAKEAVTPKTRAVIAVHLYGQMAPVEELRAVLPDSVLVVEDAAQSQGARRLGARSGSVGDIAATSFYPGKNLGAYGDAGAVLTSSSEMAERVRGLRNHGGLRKYEHELVGVNSRLDSVQAAVLSVKLTHLDSWNAERAAAAARYTEMLRDLEGVVTPRTAERNQHVWHLYVVQVANRDAVLRQLHVVGVDAGIHYPVPVHLLPAFRYLERGHGSFPVAEGLAERILSLPLYPGITDSQQARVVTALAQAMTAAGSGG